MSGSVRVVSQPCMKKKERAARARPMAWSGGGSRSFDTARPPRMPPTGICGGESDEPEATLKRSPSPITVSGYERYVDHGDDEANPDQGSG